MKHPGHLKLIQEEIYRIDSYNGDLFLKFLQENPIEPGTEVPSELIHEHRYSIRAALARLRGTLTHDINKHTTKLKEERKYADQRMVDYTDRKWKKKRSHRRNQNQRGEK